MNGSNPGGEPVVIVVERILLFITLFLFYQYTVEWVRNRPSRIRRKRIATLTYAKNFTKEIVNHKEMSELSTHRLVSLETLKKWVQDLALFKTNEAGLSDFLRQAGVRFTSQEWIILCSVLFVVPNLFGVLLGQIGFGFLIGCLGCYSPVIYARLRMKKRKKAFDAQLNDMLAILSNSLKSGYSFLQAVQMIAGDMAPPISEEFDHMLREIRMGIPTEEALQSLNFRVHSQDFDLIVTAIIIQRQIGGNLAEILDNISDTIRERVRIQGEIKALTAQGRFSAMIFLILPTAIGGLLTLINPKYVSQLFTNPIGWGMLGIGILGQVMGGFIIRKIVTIEV